METIYQDIAARTGGNIYIGVVGPVRTGKSTLIKRIMEQLVIPNIEDVYRAERARDELPQSGSGKTIMTSEPKFVPEEAVEICPDGSTQLKIRMIDSVGYMVDGAVGATEDGVPRMVTTPWYDHEIPMTEAAELGTKKVMQEHCSIGIVVTTDGTVTDIPRGDYVTAEAKAITDMQATGKPFLVILNSSDPQGQSAQETEAYLKETFGTEVFTTDCQAMDPEQIRHILGKILYAFPMAELRVHMPRWLDALDPDHPIKQEVYSKLLEVGEKIQTLAHGQKYLPALKELSCVSHMQISKIDPAKGCIHCELRFPEVLFYEILSQQADLHIENEGQLLKLLMELSAVKQEYDKISEALSSAKATGYGIVMPTEEEMSLQPPQILRKGSSFGVKLKADAPSIHMIRVDIDTEISPMVGDEKQSQDLIDYLSGESPEKLWQSNIFGKSVYALIQEGITSKLLRTPQDVRNKFRGSLSRIVNEGATGLICLIL